MCVVLSTVCVPSGILVCLCLSLLRPPPPPGLPQVLAARFNTLFTPQTPVNSRHCFPPLTFIHRASRRRL